MKKWFVLLLMVSLAICVVTGCDGFVPSEGEGEDENQVVMIELYIQDGCQNCPVVEQILEQMAEEEYTKDELILVELAPYGSSTYVISEAKDRLYWYFTNSADRGTPNILFNGLQDRIYGKSNYNNIKTKIEAQLSLSPTIQLQASRTANSFGTVINGKVKNISNSELTDLVVNGMVFKDRKEQGYRFSVTDIFEDEKVMISLLTAGKEVDFTITIEGLNWDSQNLDGVIFVQSINHPKKVIRQAVFLE